MSNELTISEDSGEARAGSATEGFTTGNQGTDFASRLPEPGRKAEIARIMATDIHRYYDEKLDAEYAALLEAEQSEINPDLINPTRPMDAHQSRTALCSSEAGRRLVSDWDEMGGFRTHLSHVQADVGNMVKAMGGNREQRVFMERFDRDLPEEARYAVYAEIAAGPSIYVTPAPAAEVKRFQATPAGSTLVAEWGSFAPEKVAMLRARAKRLTDNLTDDEAHGFWFWLDELQPAIAAVIFRKMAG
ncbi:hypothetical protein NLY43_31435 [Mesorhizobium sp. C416B]|uniref:hypothetical protein n=1 Tax=unclassified Mesorhizobium TaxID=325217 RepID=UPI0003CE293A|nr:MULTISPECIES: hypothetical protein [unclassified Mesorhizobium]ESX50149.1 hypothetical protein X762_08925 [Mesorhizobium sp. LSHC426A00]ESX57578.1 hypothetical protein X761_07835 [Mesorhizobium sp. LSHC424B00]ESX74849.1 hypothetical protein X758_04125 [Mesorhizobium sp. LSHC416B00]WJI63032.1 hypothetical protein NLY43_31435 [Mesorhizobium sp. C416B]